MVQVYTPCVFLVMLAGFSLWMDPRATPARVALSLTTLLTTATIWSSVNARMPKVSYVKAIDIYFLVSFGFVFSTLLQYILLLTLKHQTHLRKLRKISQEPVLSERVSLNQYHYKKKPSRILKGCVGRDVKSAHHQRRFSISSEKIALPLQCSL